MISQHRLCWTSDHSELVPENDPRAAFLCSIPGRPLAEGKEQLAYRRFLEGMEATGAEEPQASDDAEEKELKTPPETKVIYPPENKRTDWGPRKKK